MIRGEMVDLGPIAVGAGVLLGTSALAALLAGPVDAVPAIMVAGVLGGAVTGWLGVDAVEVGDSLQRGGFLGLHASGLGGVVVLAAMLVIDVSAMAEEGDVLLLFVASPVAVVAFALEGLLGGYVGGGLRLLYLRRTREE